MNRNFQFKLWHIITAVAVCLLVGAALGQKASNLSFGKSKTNPDFASLSSLYNTLAKKFDGTIDPTKALEGARAGLVGAAGDPYTTYLTAAQAKELQDSLDGTISGIGTEIGIKNNKLTIIAPVAASPAERAGLKAGDVITAVDGADTSGLSLDEAVSKIRGPKGTQVKLTVISGNQAPRTITITREVITVPSVKSEIKTGGVGYIQISEFGSDTAAHFNEAATKLKRAGVSKIILDLRNNPGGYLDAAQSVSSHFLAHGKVVVDERRGSTIIDTLTSDGGDLENVRLIVLINKGSASASEILAGAIQDHHRGTIMGETSFGKGSVQAVENLSGAAELKVTIAHWYTPGGRNITKEGIKPDVVVTQTQADDDAGRDPQLEAALKAIQI